MYCRYNASGTGFSDSYIANMSCCKDYRLRGNIKGEYSHMDNLYRNVPPYRVRVLTYISYVGNVV